MPWTRDDAVAHLQKFAQPKSLGKCGRYTREAIEAGGIVLARHASAKDYGISLKAVGFGEYHSEVVGNFLKGDVVIIQGFDGHPHGHMAMFDGRNWISDFVQTGLYPGSAYRKNKPTYRIYRYGVLLDNTRRMTSSTYA